MSHDRQGAGAPVIEDAQFLVDRLDDLDIYDSDFLIRDWHGHIEPAIARLRTTLAKARGEA